MKNLLRFTFLLSISLWMYCATEAQVKETRNLSSFNKICANGAMELILKQGNKESINIEASNIDLSNIETEVKGNTLCVGLKKGNYRNLKLKMILTYRQIDEIDINGSIELSNEQILKTSKLVFNLSGSGTVDLKIDVEELKVKSAGAGEIKLDGSATHQHFTLSGASNIEAFKLIGQDTDITINGAGNVNAYAKNKITATINGIGNIQYKGNPSQTNFKKNGMGNISSKQ